MLFGIRFLLQSIRVFWKQKMSNKANSKQNGKEEGNALQILDSEDNFGENKLKRAL